MAQVVEASLGRIPANALAISVEVFGEIVSMRFQLTEMDRTDQLEMTAIADELARALGSDVSVQWDCELAEEWRTRPPASSLRYTYLSRPAWND